MSTYINLLVGVFLVVIVILGITVLNYRRKIKALHVHLAENPKDAIIENNNKLINVNVENTVIEASTGELNLIGVNEETAAIIIATIADYLKLPLDELQFKSIKALD